MTASYYSASADRRLSGGKYDGYSCMVNGGIMSDAGLMTFPVVKNQYIRHNLLTNDKTRNNIMTMPEAIVLCVSFICSTVLLYFVVKE